MSKRALGRGIEALLKDDEGEVREVSLNQLVPGRHQPRQDFSEEQLRELADSIKQKGILQPILVEKREDGKYGIIAGERRYRAAGMAEIKNVPVLVRSFTELEKLEIALIENLQREDLSPIEEARAMEKLIRSGGYNQEEAARRLGKKRSTIANSIRLLKLPEDMIAAIHAGRLSPGHARAILSVNRQSDQAGLFKRILAEGFSVREAERLAEKLNVQKRTNTGENRSIQKSPELQVLEQGFIELLGTRVVIRGNDSRGKIEISYFSSEDLDRIWSLFK